MYGDRGSTFSLRNFIKNGKDIDSTFGKIKDMGYTCVQFSGATFEPFELKDIIDKYNLPVYLTHVDATRISEDTENVIKEHKIIGCQNIGLGAMPHAFPFMGDIEEVDAFIKILRRGPKDKGRRIKVFLS